MQKFNTEKMAMIAVALSGLAWGIFWIPLRALEHQGIAGIWSVVMFYTVPALMMLPVYATRGRKLASAGVPFHISGILAGLALVFYSGALVFTDVIRALLFFYLTPLWSSLLARVVLGERITAVRWITMATALVGLLLVLRIDEGLEATLNFGDWMGLASGIIWAFAAVRIKSDEVHDSVDYTLSYFFWGSLAAFVLASLPLASASPAPDTNAITTALPWFLPIALILIIPPSMAVMWGARMISPGLLPIIFMTEISAGSITAAIWAGEPFGAREIAGVILITSAGLIEPLWGLRHKTTSA